MKVIFLKNFRNGGKAGDIKEISDGYANNYLIPNGIAEKATPGSIKRLDNLKRSRLEKEREAVEKFEAMAKGIGGRKIEIAARSKNGKLFGSISKKEVVSKIKEMGFEIGEEAVIMDPIKEVGEKEIILQIHPEVRTKIILVIKEK